MTELSKENKEFLFALCLGDGYLTRPLGNKNVALECGHSIKQLEYLTWKRDKVFEILGGFKPPKIGIRKICLKSNGQTYDSCRFSKAHPYFSYLRKILYINNVKFITEQSLDLLSPQGLAIWFMDDGWGFNIKNRKGELTDRMCLGISTDSFSKEENEIIAKVIFKRFGIKFHINCKYSPCGEHKKLWFLRTNSKEQTQKFIELIKPYMHPSMLYKIQNKNLIKSHECDTPIEGEDIV